MQRLLIVLGTLVLCVAPAYAVGAQSADTGATRARPGPAPSASAKPAISPGCCTVVRLDTARAIATARETATGFTFRFEVKPKRLLSGIKIGQTIWADFTRKTVKLRATEAAPCCTILTQETP